MRVLLAISLDAGVVADLRSLFPDVEFVEAAGRERLEAEIPTADVVYGGHVSEAMVAAAPQLRWIQAFSAGINHLPLDALAERSIVLTNASGAHAIQIAENILAMMFAFAVRIPTLLEAKRNRTWISGAVNAAKFELFGHTLLIAGLGGIGAGLAARASALGMRVVGVRNRPLPPPPGVDAVVPRDRLLEALAEADHVALCLPLTDETTAFLGEAELRAMRTSAYVYNVGRGASIDPAALHRALTEGWIAGAGLDVTEPEPLPADDPLWEMPNIILTQHTSGNSPDIDRRVTAIFADNLRRFRTGQPLRNVIDYARRY